MQRHFKITINERQRDGRIVTLHPEYIGDIDEQGLVKIFGLEEPDVTSYDIREVEHRTAGG